MASCVSQAAAAVSRTDSSATATTLASAAVREPLLVDFSARRSSTTVSIRTSRRRASMVRSTPKEWAK